jgi:chloride channel protein, CIC family
MSEITVPDDRSAETDTSRHSIIPRKVRALIRSDETSLALLAAVIGAIAGLCVAGMVFVIQWVHHVLFAVEGHEVSGAEFVEPLRAFFVPALGGILVGLLAFIHQRRKTLQIIDPVEANALYGGRMPIRGSLFLVLQTMVSNGVGGSIGMEAGYTQIGSALASKIGKLFHVRRNDLRTLVGCGAAGAIAAAFDAPLTGAFYAFELIISTYSIGMLAPVVVAAISAFGVMKLVMPQATFQVGFAGALSLSDYTLVFFMAFLSSLVAIAMMMTVTFMERLFAASRLPVWARPVVGGICVGAMALVTPAVLSSGHSALHVGFGAYYTAPFLLLLIVLKILASATSIASGFRGGLFFASLFLGAMLGKLVAIGWMLAFGLQIPAMVVAIIGMCAMATAVLGAPLTMSFLALETTGSLPLTAAVLAAAVVSSLTARRVFGYSFATWRFHLRGESIRSAADVGWVRELSVGRMMRKDVRTVLVDTPLERVRRDFPLGATQRVIVTDYDGSYCGMVFVPDLHRDDGEVAESLSDLLRFTETMLTPDQNVRQAIDLFEKAECDALAVVENRSSMRVLGLLTEQHALRRYSEELDRRANETYR